MILFVLKRVALTGLMLFGLVCITFTVSNVAPSDPAALAAGPDATRDMVETIRREYGLDRPLPEQFVRYLGGLLQGDLGRSIVTTRPVTQDLARYFPATLELVLLSMTLGVLVGVPMGMVSAVLKNRAPDHATRFVAVSLVALPAFWFGILLQLLFSVQLEWLPTSGRLEVATPPPPPLTGMLLFDSLASGQWATFGDALSHAVLPALVLSFPCLASILRVNRAEMIEVLGSDYVTAARAHGISRLRVVCVLALRNAMLPTLAIIGLRWGWMLGSTVLVETVFDWPGIGLYAVSSAIAGDFKPVMGVTLLIGLNFMIANLIVDILYGVLDPRLRTAP
ncbi:ABC transporter permease [Neoroseomonas rubea]|uniref:ABC transporter permease n=1 Tax=Neoroseomonas rubea TaxID=2748666 RepID=UPI0018DF6639|nr:ABC transporter permease [Roseomonas rubea]